MKKKLWLIICASVMIVTGCGKQSEIRDRETIQSEIDALQQKLDALDEQATQADTEEITHSTEGEVHAETDNKSDFENNEDSSVSSELTEEVSEKQMEPLQIEVPDELKNTKIGALISEKPNAIYTLNESIPCGLVRYDITEADISEYFGNNYTKETKMIGHLQGGDFRMAYSDYELAGVKGKLNFVFRDEKLIGVCLFSYSSENIEDDCGEMVAYIETKTGLEPFTYTIGQSTTTTLNEVRNIDYICGFNKDDNLLRFEAHKNGVIETAQEAKARIDHEIDVAEQRAEWGNDTYDKLNENLGNKNNTNNSEGTSSKSNSASETLSSDDKVLYWTIAKDEVKSKLKSPSTAKFPFAANSEGVSISKSGDIVTVSAYVDAQNSFGATLRNNFTVKIKTNGTKYSIESCSIY